MNFRIVIKGLGAAFGEHEISNEMLAHLVRAGMFTGVDVGKIRHEAAFGEWHARHAHLPEDIAAFCYSAEAQGLHTRYHIAPYPAGRRLRHHGVDVAELGARAAQQALDQAGLTGQDIDAWLVSAITAQAGPGIASLVKEYFCGPGTRSITRSMQAGCGSFSMMVKAAREIFLSDPAIRNIAVVHADTVSPYLYNQGDYVRPLLFGDGGAAVVLSRADALAEGADGLLAVTATQEPGFMGHLGLNMYQEMYHEPGEVKKLAVQGMVDCAKQVLVQAGLTAADVDWFIPHQTGNGIVNKTARLLGIADERVHRDAQWRYGNVSGATVPVGLWCIERAGQLKPGQLVLGTSAGVGGDIGAFLYRVPQDEPARQRTPRLAGRCVLLTGASGAIGKEALGLLLAEGADVTVLHNGAPLDLPGVREHLVDFADRAALQGVIDGLVASRTKFDALINNAATGGTLANSLTRDIDDYERVWRINFQAPVMLTTALARAKLLRGQVLHVGSSAEDHQAAGTAPYVASKRALHGWAASAASELARVGIRSTYFQLALVGGGMSSCLSASQVAEALEQHKQRQPLTPSEVAGCLVTSLWANKVPGTFDTQENGMTVRRVGYQFTHPLADR